MIPDSREAVMASVYEFLGNNFPLMRKGNVTPETLLLEQGIVDSLGLLLIVEFIESTYEVRVGVEHMVVENFGSIAAIADFILHQRNPLANQRNPLASQTAPATVAHADMIQPGVGLE